MHLATLLSAALIGAELIAQFVDLALVHGHLVGSIQAKAQKYSAALSRPAPVLPDPSELCDWTTLG